MSLDDVAGLPPTLQLLDWRRRVAALYLAVRTAGNPEAAWQAWMQGRTALYRRHPQSPLPAEVRAKGRLPLFFAYDPALRFVVDVAVIKTPPRARTVDVGDDGALSLTPALQTIGLAQPLGAELTIFALGGYGGGLLLAFKDATSGAETYGGGRYLLDTIKSADLGLARDGRMILDFNFAYQPSCCHAPTWVCPLAPPENTLGAAVRGGERL
ncbi:MAG: DUF1684 domain-containing protein [Pseudomonadota bacterium]